MPSACEMDAKPTNQPHHVNHVRPNPNPSPNTNTNPNIGTGIEYQSMAIGNPKPMKTHDQKSTSNNTSEIVVGLNQA